MLTPEARATAESVVLTQIVQRQAEDSRRIVATLRDLGMVHPSPERTHYDGCWQHYSHGDCLAVRLYRTLTEETTDA